MEEQELIGERCPLGRRRMIGLAASRGAAAAAACATSLAFFTFLLAVLPAVPSDAVMVVAEELRGSIALA